MSEALTFGPEWLRALSSGTSVTSPPASPGMVQFKLAEHRYGREEMLALYKKTEKPPIQIEEFQSIGKKECLTPMALTPLNEEEQRCLSQCVNSSVVLRITGRGGGGAGPPSLRGARGTGRGRGRGRGDYQRSVSNYDDGDSGGFSGRREFNRTLSWDEGNDHRLYDKSHRTDSRNYDDTGPPSPRKHIERGSLSDNWRIPRERQLSRTEEEDGGDGGWRHASRSGRSPRDNDDNWRTAPGERGSLRTNWHHPRERPGFDGDRDRPREFSRPGENRERRYSGRNRQDSWHEDNSEEMPEWTMDDDPFDLDSIGTFDASGAFLSVKPEDLKKFEEEKAAASKGAKEDKEKNGDLEKEKDKTSAEENHKPTKQRDLSSLSSKSEKSSSNESQSISDNKLSPHSATSNIADQTLSSNNVAEVKNEARTSPLTAANAKSKTDGALQAQSLQNIEAQMLQSSGKVAIDATESAKTPAVAPAEGAANKTTESAAVSQEQKLAESVAASGVAAATEEKSAVLEDEDDGLEHLEKAAESLMAELDEGEDDKVPDIDVDVQVASDSTKALAATHENAQKWLYKDPQGQVQGPFQSTEMAEWFSAGYFTMSLLVKRGCDEEFLCLGDVIKRWGRVPFVQGPEPPPLAQKAAVSAPPASSVAPSVSPPVVVQAALAAAAAQQQAPQQTQPQPAAPQVVNPNPQIAQLLAQVQAAAAAAASQQQQQHQQQQQQQQHAMHQQQVFQQVLQQQQALIRVHASRIYSELVQRGQTLTPTQQQVLRSQLITLQQQHQLLLKQQQQYQTLAQLSMAGEGPGSGDHPPSIPTHSTVAAAQAAAAAAIQSSNQAAGKDVSKSVMENISMWGVPHKDRGEWDIGFWDPSMAKEIIEEERKFRELERLRKAEEHRKQVEHAAEEERKNLEEMRRQQEILRKEEQKRREEEATRQEEMQKLEDERRQEDLKRQEEIRRLEDLQRADEERRQEEQRRIEQQRQDDLRRQQEESSRKAQEEANRRAQEEASRRAQDEAAATRRAQEEDAARRAAQEEASKRRAREEQEKLRQEEDRKNSERQRQELMRQQEMQRQQEAQRQQQQQQEALRRLQQQQQSKLPSTAMWGQNTNTTSATPTTSSGTPTLSQIQQLQAQQEERDREERQRQMAQLQQQQHQQQQSQNRPGWGSPNQGIPVSVSGPTKSLREIQEEQARQQMERSKQQAKAQANLSMATASSGVWGSSNSNSMTWGNEPPSSWGNPQTNKAAPMGFWDECARDATNTNPVLKTNNNANFPALRGSAPSTLQQQQRQQNANKSRSAKEEETVRKLFQANLPSDEFTQWCEYMLQGMASSVDIPTFITFLQDVESPYEVHDYVKMYLGESRDTAEFARQFLERRNRQREQQRKQREMESNWMGQPVKGHPQQGNLTGMGDWEDVTRGNSGINNKKKKKGKQLVDPKILGFSVNAAERPNIGEIQSIDD